MRSDAINIALAALVFVNTLAVVQFQTLAQTNPPATFKVSAVERSLSREWTTNDSGDVGDHSLGLAVTARRHL